MRGANGPKRSPSIASIRTATTNRQIAAGRRVLSRRATRGREFVRRRRDPYRVATVTLARSDVFPVGTTVGIYPGNSINPGQAPGSAVIASAAVDAAGLLTVTNAGILSLTPYIASASVNGVWQSLRVRSTLDVFDYGRATGTATTTNASASLTLVSPTTGAFAIGQRVVGAGIPAGTFLISGSGASWTMSDKATASAAGVAIEGHGAQVGAAVLGATVVPSRIATKWRAQLMQRRATAGTS